ncbi:DUF2516 family protein [Corynebacterium aquatimens]|nr:DUF2516 family protein [Corynebacterium aquatimens]
MLIPELLRLWLLALVGVCGIVGAVQVGLTRADAFPAADRMPKVGWVALLLIASLACLSMRPFFGIIGAVVIGIYFFDVRPHLKNILSGNYGW